MNRTTRRRASRNRAVPSTGDTVPPEKSATGESPAGVPDPIARGRFVVVAAAGVVWIVALALLAAFTANPVTVSPRQIEEADLVVLVRVIDPVAGTVQVEQSWKGPLDETELTIDNLKETRAQADQRYLIPLQRTRQGRYFIGGHQPPRERRPSPGGRAFDQGDEDFNRRPVVYPAGPAGIEQIERTINNSRAVDE